MGNFQEAEINEKELEHYLKDGINMHDLVNGKKAFMSLDKDGTGTILYDTKKISDVNKYDLPVEDDNGKVLIDFNKFMNIMIDNIITNRIKFGRESTVYESETSTVMCIGCPFKSGSKMNS